MGCNCEKHDKTSSYFEPIKSSVTPVLNENKGFKELLLSKMGKCRFCMITTLIISTISWLAIFYSSANQALAKNDYLLIVLLCIVVGSSFLFLAHMFFYVYYKFQ